MKLVASVVQNFRSLSLAIYRISGTGRGQNSHIFGLIIHGGGVTVDLLHVDAGLRCGELSRGQIFAVQQKFGVLLMNYLCEDVLGLVSRVPRSCPAVLAIDLEILSSSVAVKCSH
jgi:hypothetical protein